MPESIFGGSLEKEATLEIGLWSQHYYLDQLLERIPPRPAFVALPSLDGERAMLCLTTCIPASIGNERWMAEFRTVQDAVRYHRVYI